MGPSVAIPHKKLTTAGICGGIFVMGVGNGVIGPTLLTLAENINQEISALSFLVFAKGLGYVAGSYATQFLSNKITQYFLLAFSLMLMAVGEALCPLVPNPSLVIIAMFIAGIGMGMVENVGLVTISQIWEEKSDPFVQIAQLFYGFGSVVSPLLAKPFITSLENFTNKTQTENSLNTSITTLPTTPPSGMTFPYVAWTYFIIAAMSLIFLILFVILGCMSPTLYSPKKSEKSERDGTVFRSVFLFVMVAFYTFHVSSEVCIGSYLFSFMVLSEMKAGNDIGITVNIVWWVFYMLGSIATIFASTRYLPKKILNVDMVGLAVSMTMLLCFPLYVHSAPTILWIGIAMHALFLANVYPTGITFTAHTILLNSSATAVISIGTGLGEMLIPMLIASFINDHPNVFLWVLGANTSLVIITYLLLLFISSKKSWFKRRQRPEAKDENEDDPML